jgi:hypothetical protein
MEEVTFVLEADEKTSARLKQSFEERTKTDVVSAKRTNLDGAAATFVTILQASSPIISAVIPLVIEILKQKKVSRIKLNDVEIENPTEEQLNRVWQKLEKSDGKGT